MLVVHLARKPLSEPSVAANALKHHTGALNISASRISTQDNLNGGAYAQEGSERWDGAENWRYKRGLDQGTYRQPEGRWPANLALQHHPGCLIDTVCGLTDCVPECPVKDLDQQSGEVGAFAPVCGTETSPAVGKHGVYSERERVPGPFHGDKGGASRFFKQVTPDD